jgi:DNA polymerase
MSKVENMKTLHADFETRSTVDLKKAGASVYAAHPTTEALCMAYAFGDEPIQAWRKGEPLPARVRAHVEAGGQVVGHNVGFEWQIWNLTMRRHGWPPLAIEQCQCTATTAAAMQLPRTLEGAAKAVGLPIEKDMVGNRLMLQMCKPRKMLKAGDKCPNCKGKGYYGPKANRATCNLCGGTGVQAESEILWWDDAEKMDRLVAYCKTDVEVERQLETKLVALRPQELQMWHLDHKINTRGIRCDLSLVRAAEVVVAASSKRLDQEMKQATGGAVTACGQVQKLVDWLQRQGVDTQSVAKDVLEEWLEIVDLVGMPPVVQQVLELRREAAKASTAKLKSMQACVSADERIRGMFLFNGAGTGRWSGRLVQVHNLPRPKMKAKEIEQALPLLRAADTDALELVVGPAMSVVSDSLRTMFVAAPGKEFVAADFSNIEGRVLAWVAGQDDKVELFRHDGPIYERMGSAIFNVPVEKVTKDSLFRQVGKQAELGCGYGMGPPKFVVTCWKQGHLRIPTQMAETAVKAYRQKNDKIVALWKELEAAASEAIENPGTIVTAARGLIQYRRAGTYLWCRLPSGRCLCYPYPKLQPRVWVTFTDGSKKAFFGANRTDTDRKIKEHCAAFGLEVDDVKPQGAALTFMGVNSTTKRWERQSAYGGLLVENVVQAIARDLLAEAMVRVEAEGYPVVMHVHDEIVAEVDEGFGDLHEFELLMAVVPTWAGDCPVKAEGWRGKRYRK